MLIDYDLVPSAGITYLVVTHVPIQGYGYQVVHNFDTDTPGSAELINSICKRLTTSLRAQFQADNTSHSLFEYALTDHTLLSLCLSRIDRASADEMGRKGIVHGIYLQQHVDRSSLIKCDRFLTTLENRFSRIEEEHRRIRELASKTLDSELLVTQFVGVLRETLRDCIESLENSAAAGAHQLSEESVINADTTQAPGQAFVPAQRRRFARLWERDQRRW